tara:strand:- start:5 stop:745 length:741 start_codon:yes stop_codon:yes gene_type:complete
MSNYPTATYANLKSRFQALAGLESLQTTDAGFLRDLVNRRARLAHERYPWPQFTVIGEQVAVVTSDANTLRIYGTSNKLASNANVVFRIHKSDPSTTRYPEEYTYYTELDSGGFPSIKIVDPTVLNSVNIYVTYRKDLRSEINSGSATTGYYGDDAGDNSAVPNFFLEYLVQGAYADFLRGDGQTSKAAQEEQNAESILTLEIDMVREQGRQFRNDILQYRPPSQFARHNVQAGGSPISPGVANVQ